MVNVLSGVALLLAVVALVYAWRLHAELDRAAARLDRYNKALFDAGEELRQVRARGRSAGGWRGAPTGGVQDTQYYARFRALAHAGRRVPVESREVNYVGC